MAAGFSSLNTTLYIGHSSLAINVQTYGGAWCRTYIYVDGAEVPSPIGWCESGGGSFITGFPNTSGTIYVTVGGFKLKLVFSSSGYSGAIGSNPVPAKLDIYFEDSINYYTGPDWLVDDGTEFMRITQSTVAGGDQWLVANTLQVTMPVIQELI